MNFTWQCKHCSRRFQRATLFVLRLDALAHVQACAEEREREAKKQAAKDAQPQLALGDMR